MSRSTTSLVKAWFCLTRFCRRKKRKLELTSHRRRPKRGPKCTSRPREIRQVIDCTLEAAWTKKTRILMRRTTSLCKSRQKRLLQVRRQQQQKLWRPAKVQGCSPTQSCLLQIPPMKMISCSSREVSKTSRKQIWGSNSPIQLSKKNLLQKIRCDFLSKVQVTKILIWRLVDNQLKNLKTLPP